MVPRLHGTESDNNSKSLEGYQSKAMTLSPSTVSAALGKALCESMKDELESLKLVSLSEAASMLDVSERTVSKLTGGEMVDVGGKGLKVKLSTIKRIIQERTIRIS